MAVNPIPQGYPRLIPTISVDDGRKAIDFYTGVLGAKSRAVFEDGDKVGHAELEFGDSLLMLADEYPDMGYTSPTNGGPAARLWFYSEDVDAQVAKAVEAGATVLEPASDQFYGDRTAKIQDPFGHQWTISTHVEDVSEEEMAKRIAEWQASQNKSERAPSPPG